MATGGGPPEPSSPKKSAQSDQEEEESAPTAPFLLCVQCTHELRDPHLLCCLHCACKECLERVEQQDGRLKCPQCGDTSTHPPQGQHSVRACRPSTAEVQCVPVRCVSLAQHIEVGKLLQKITSGEPILCSNSVCDNPESPAIVLCFKCKEFLCQPCNTGHRLMSKKLFSEGHTVKSLSELRSLPPSVLRSLVPQTVTPVTCPCHEGEPLKYSCEQCDTLLCQACTVDKDLGHQPRYLNRAAVAQHAQCLVVAQEAVVRSGEVHQKTAARLEAQSTSVDGMRERALQDTEQAFQAIQVAIDTKKEELRNQIVAVSDEKKQFIEARTQSCSSEGESLAARTALSFLLANGSSHEVVACRRLAHVRQSAATSQCRGGGGGAPVSPVVRFLPQQEEALLTAIREFGHIQEGASPLHCTLDPKPEELHQSPPVVLTLTAVDSSNIPCSGGGESVEAFLRPRPPVPGPAIKAKVEDRRSGQYKVVFGVVYTGESELSVLVNGGHVRGSPFAVQLDAAIVQNGHWVMSRSAMELGAMKGSLRFPQQPGCLWGVAVSPVSGSVFVSDYGSSQVHVFDVERKHVRTFGQRMGKGEGQLNKPQGIDISANGQLFVANQNNHCVSVFREDGTFIRTIGRGKLQYPWDVFVHSSGLVYVADSNNHRIAVFSQGGELVRTFGSRGRGKGQFECPSGVAVSPDNRLLYVCDLFNHRVQVFTPEGQHVREFGTDQLRDPHGLTVASNGSVLVAGGSHSCVAVFDKKEELVHSIAVEDPTGLAIDSRGDLLVASLMKSCVYYF